MKKCIVVMVLCLCVTGAASAQNIVWVSDGAMVNGGTDPDDQGFIDLLTTNGYTVDYQLGGYWQTLDAGKIAALNAADLVIIGRGANSGLYDDGTEPTDWNNVTAPMILTGAFLARNSRWKWLDNGTNPDNTLDVGNPDPLAEAVDLSHPVLAGITLDAFNKVALTTQGTTFNPTTGVGNGHLIAQVDSLHVSGATNNPAGAPWIAEWATGTEFYAGAGQTAGGWRMLFDAGASHNDPPTAGWGDGEFNLTGEGPGVTAFLNAVDYMITIPEPATMSLLALGGLAALRRRRR